MSIDNDQNERLASLEANSQSLGRSIDKVRDQFEGHEATCAENWKEQHERTTRMETKLHLILWVAGSAAAAGLAAVAEGTWARFFGG